MKILQLANFYHPRSGGLRTTLDALAAGYRAAGHDVVLGIPGPATRFDRSGVRPVLTIRSPRLPASGGYATVVNRRALVRLIDRFRPDVVELSDKTTLAALLASVPDRPPVVMISHERLDHVLSLHLPQELAPARLAERWTERITRCADVVVCASAYAASEIDPHHDDVRRIPLGVDLGTFRPAEISSARPMPGGCGASDGASPRDSARSRQAIHVGRLSPEKFPQRAVDAIARLRRWGVDAELTMVGDGPLRAELERQAAGLPVRFLGHVTDRRAVAALIAASDVTIAPSPQETFGLAALESMACGTPVVSPRGGAVAELTDARGGVAAGPGADGLAIAMAEVFRGEPATRRDAARHRAEQFPWERTTDAMLAVFGAVTGCRAVAQEVRAA